MNAAHLDYETLADLAEGLLDDEQAASANDHLVDCDICLSRSADLADVSQLLADAPVPPLPVELAQRIDDAIAAESSTSPAAAGTPPHRRRHLRLLSAAAAAVVAVGGGALVGNELLRSSASPDFTKSQAAQDPGDNSVGSAGGVPPGAPAPAASPKLAPGARPGPGAYRLIASGTDYKGATLGSQVGTALRSKDTGTVTSATGLAECVSQISKGEDPVLVDVARYNGRQAMVIVLRGSDPHELDVWVVGPKCSATVPDVITRTRAADN
ncbi:anti-sigma factor family protein [Actinomadura scrupuli]|uniref:anti-sigma factor family protein n=1 Tax=Actinomadura scrupuli TaxID=559629 RepID=UPI003D952A9C